jgi:uncharacterized protein (DUF885 family)
MAELDRLLEEFFAFWWRTHPTYATAVGLHEYDGELERYDAASLAERARHLREYLERFRRYAPRTPAEALDVELVRSQLAWELYEHEEVRLLERNPLHYIEGPLNALYLCAVREYAPAEERARRAAERLRALPRVLEEARENLRAAAPELAETAAQVARSGLGLIEQLLPLHLGRALEDDVAQFTEWENARRGAEAALVAYARWLEEELAPRATGNFALGRVAFETRLRYAHGLSDTAESLAAYGEALKRETERELDAIAAGLDGRRRGWREVYERLREDHPPAGELLAAYRDAVTRAREFVLEHELATLPAGEALDVVATPEYLRPLIPYAAYQPPAAHEAEQRGLFFVTIPAPDAEPILREHSVYGIPITALHEAYPGHHLQLSRANRADTEPRRVFWTPVFAEGWALYCEELMWEQGFYADPRQRLFQLRDLLWRACRVVVDVGLHAGGWRPERAREYLVREAALEPQSAEAEVRRYCAEATQPMSYAVGKREILRLRELYRARAGTAFRLGDFHDRLLQWGTIPPSLIARVMGLE